MAKNTSVLAIAASLASFCIAAGPSSVWDGAYTAEQSKRGQAAFNKTCASCHGDTLAGGESAPPLSGGEFLANWNGLTAGDLFERIRTTMPPGRGGKLPREINADILAYIFSFNEFPAGDQELPKATEVLKTIRIEMVKSAKK